MGLVPIALQASAQVCLEHITVVCKYRITSKQDVCKYDGTSKMEVYVNRLRRQWGHNKRRKCISVVNILFPISTWRQLDGWIVIY